jgi:hypothetical protein
LALVSSNADTDLPAAVELAVSETERVGGTEKRIDVRSRTCPPQGVRASASAATTVNQ